MKRKLILPLLLVLVITCWCLAGCLGVGSIIIDGVSSGIESLVGNFLHKHQYDQGVCIQCGRKCSHSNFEQGICTKCGWKCTHGSYIKGVCKCGMPCTHKYRNGVCTICDTKCPNHSLLGGKCKTCGQQCSHKYSQGVCSICLQPCTHNYVLGECTVCGQEDENYRPNLQQILTGGKQNFPYVFSGVVFGVASNGFYVNDTFGSIFVQSSTSVAVGDQVQVTGTYVLTSSVFKTPLIKATDVAVEDNSQPTLAPTKCDLTDVKAFTVAYKNYYQYLTVIGYVEPDNGGYVLSWIKGSSAKVKIAADSTKYVSSLEGKQVQATIVLTGYTFSMWEARILTADSVSQYIADIDDVKQSIFSQEQERLSRQIYFYLELPTSYPLAQSVEYRWEVARGSEIEIVDNVLYVRPPLYDTPYVELTITSNGESASLQIPVSIAPGPQATFEEAKQCNTCRITGTVLTVTVDQEQRRHSVVLLDQNNNMIQVAVQNDGYENIKKGDNISVAGFWGYDKWSIGYFNANAYMTNKSAPDDYTTNLSNLNVVTLETLQDYQDFLVNWQQKTTDITIVKIVNPYLIYSGTTIYNYVRFGPDESAGSLYSVEADSKTYSRVFCFQINALDKECPNLRQLLDIPLLDAGVAVQNQLVVYAIPLYGGETTLQFSIIDADLVQVGGVQTSNAVADALALQRQAILPANMMDATGKRKFC